MSADNVIQWRVCPSFPSYEVSEFGDIRRCRPMKHTGRFSSAVLRPKIQGGYKRHTLHRDGRGKSIHAYRKRWGDGGSA